MKKLIAALILPLACTLFAASPFQWKWQNSGDELKLTLSAPADTHVYSSSLKIEAGKLKPVRSPKPLQADDPVTGTKIPVFRGGDSWFFKPAKADFPLRVRIEFQGCSGETCYLPETVSAEIPSSSGSGLLAAEKTAAGSSAGTVSALPEFRILRSAGGYMNQADFLAFLNGKKNASLFDFAGRGAFAILLLTLLGGILLNLTPCILPMIPINLAIIGADDPSKKGSAVMRGAVYASGMALAYGGVGLAAVLFGAAFGTLASRWYFNLGAAVVFLGLGLAMFDVFSIDLTRFGASVKAPSGAKLWGVFLLGVLAALLAGACVAPVVLAVLLQSAEMYSSGNWFGLGLPFVLGIGMGLPWPILAAGLAKIPRPGKWMMHVKHAFGVLILLIGIYYGWLGTELLMSKGGSVVKGGGEAELAAAFRKARQEKKPVFIDFRADWCKNCLAMEKTTLPSEEVRKALNSGFVPVVFDATEMSRPEVKRVMEAFHVNGLPGYVIAEPGK